VKEYTVKRYSFSELKGEARERAIKDMQRRLNEWIDERELTDYLNGQIEDALGGELISYDLRYSLGYSQGDGVAIYGQITREEAPNLTWPARAEYVNLVRNQWATHYSHYNTFSVEAYDADEESVSLEGEVIETQFRDLCRELAIKGYKYIESSSDEESAITYIEDIYEDEFTLDGKYSPITNSEVA
jgi:hypothetical protein